MGSPRGKGAPRREQVVAWLEERGWQLTSMTEDQKLEMRRYWNICGAPTAVSRYTEPCCFTPYPENGRCRMHGGPSLKGIAHPNYRGKGYGRYMPDHWLPTYNSARGDPELLDLTEDLALMAVRFEQLISKVGSGDVGKAWKALEGEWGKLRNSLRLADQKERERRVQEQITAITVLINRGSAEAEAWGEIGDLQEQRRRIVETEAKRRRDMELMVRIEDAMADYQALAMAVKRVIENTDLRRTSREDLLKAIANEFARIVAISDIADAGAGARAGGGPLARSRARKALPGPRRVRGAA